MNTISQKYIKDYIVTNYGEMKHDLVRMTKAIRITAKEYDLNKKDLFHYIIERKPTIPFTQSYGFDTAYGREIRRVFQNNYLSIIP